MTSYDVTWTPHGDAPCVGATGAGSPPLSCPWQSSELPACGVRPAVPPSLRAASSQLLSAKAVLVFGTMALSSGSSPAAGFSPNGRVISGSGARQAGVFAALVNSPRCPGFDVSSLRLTEAFETAALWVEGAKRHSFSLRLGWGRQQPQPRVLREPSARAQGFSLRKRRVPHGRSPATVSQRPSKHARSHIGVGLSA